MVEISVKNLAHKSPVSSHSVVDSLLHINTNYNRHKKYVLEIKPGPDACLRQHLLPSPKETHSPRSAHCRCTHYAAGD